MSVQMTFTGYIFPDLTQQNTALPANAIIVWSGLVVDIPTNWQLCDGTNGTPDLRDRFIVGAGASYALGATGGASSVALTAPQLPSHSHTVTTPGITSVSGDHAHTSPNTAPTGVHGHPGQWRNYSSGDRLPPSNPGTGGASLATTGPAGAHTHPVSTNTQGTHSHTATDSIGNAGQAVPDPHDNLPPYYALAFIMEVSP